MSGVVVPLALTSQRGPLRLVPIDGDHMQPGLRRGDAVAVLPVPGWRGDGLYVVESLGEPVVYRCSSDFRGGIVLGRDNPLYSSDTIRQADFEQIVLGKVAVVCHVVDRTLTVRA